MAVTAPLNLITSKPALAAIAISISIETAKQLMMDKVNEIINFISKSDKKQ